MGYDNLSASDHQPTKIIMNMKHRGMKIYNKEEIYTRKKVKNSKYAQNFISRYEQWRKA
jgi:hypothetical protein